MITKHIDHLDLRQTAMSGQCFRWRCISDDTYNIVGYGRNLDITQNGDLFTLSCDEREWEDVWHHYFDLDTDYTHVEELIMTSGDEHLMESFNQGSGIRILNQELWEMIITFIISQNNNIKRITNGVEMLCEACGREIPGSARKTFPNPNEGRSEVFLDRSFGFGYRDQYLLKMFQAATENYSQIEALKNMSYEDAMSSLMSYTGIGRKVANCICLFGLHHIDAFPVDTHVKQLLAKYYPEGFDFERYKGCAGIVQQYLFYYELTH